MATSGQKLQSAVALLNGVRKGRIARALQPYGFSVAEARRGIALLNALLEVRDLDVEAEADPSLVLELDAWENQWFPIARYATEYAHPAAFEWLFRDLAQAHGPAVIVTITTFVRRWREIESGASGLGDAGKAALAALTARGVDAKQVAAAQALLDKLGDIKLADDPAPHRARAQAAEDALWNWYREWRGILRHSIKDANLLRQVGLGAKPSAVADEDDEEAPVAAPAPTTAAPVVVGATGTDKK
jgi:hypothetical protein